MRDGTSDGNAIQSVPWTPSSRSPRRSSRCASRAISCAVPRATARPELAAWAAGLAAYAVAAGALAWGAAAGWSDAAFRVYYLGGALLTAALLGAGSLLLVGRRWIAPVALVYVGPRDRNRARRPAPGEHLRDGDPRGAGRARPLARTRCSRSLGELARHARGGRRRARDLPLAPARKRADPRRHRGRGSRKRARRTGRRSASAGDRRRRGPPLRRLRRPGRRSRSHDRDTSIAASQHRPRRRSSASTIAPANAAVRD